MEKNTESSENTESANGKDDLSLIALIVTLVAIAAMAIAVVAYYRWDAGRTEEQQQREFEYITETNGELLNSWKAELWSELHEDTPIALDDGSPGVERCYYTVVPTGDLEEAEEHVSTMYPSDFQWWFSPKYQETRCETLPYDPVTGEVG